MSYAPAPYSPGLAFGGQRARKMMSRLADVVADNARRVPCEHCGLSILPENMGNHLSVVHDVEAA